MQIFSNGFRIVAASLLLLVPKLASGSSLDAQFLIPSKESIQNRASNEILVNGPFTAVRLPLNKGEPLLQPTSIATNPSGNVFVTCRTGKILYLADTDGDGLEDTTLLFADVAKDQLKYPTGLAFRGDEVFVATVSEIRIYRDSDNDGQADTSRTFASGWPISPHPSCLTFAPSFGPDGHLYVALSSSRAYGHKIKDPDKMRGAILRIAPDGKTFSVFARGTQNTSALAFDSNGHLFFPDVRGRPWSETGELNLGVRGANYGCNPYEPYRGKVTPPLLSLALIQSPSSVAFNPKTNRHFGATSGQLFVADLDNGKLARIAITKNKEGGYKTTETLFASFHQQPIGLSFGKRGDLYVVEQGAGSANGKTGSVYRYIYTPWQRTAARILPSPSPGWEPTGRKLFTQHLMCNICHQSKKNKPGGFLGPRLNDVGAHLGRRALLEAVRFPSKLIKKGFRPHLITPRNDEQRYGILEHSSKNGIHLRVGDIKMKEVVFIATDQIKSTRLGKFSLMPEGLTNQLTPSKEEDLLAFLSALRPKGAYHLRVNVGGPRITTKGFAPWRADLLYLGKRRRFGHINGTAVIFQNKADPRFGSGRTGPCAYRFRVPNGIYKITVFLRIDDLLTSGAKPFFKVRAEGDLVSVPYDPQRIIKAERRFAAACQVTVTDGLLELEFSGNEKNGPAITALEVESVLLDE